MREGLLFLHIIGAAGWIGGGLHGWFSQTQLARNASTSGRALQTLTAAWSWNDTFVLVGIGVFVFSAAFQPLVASKTEKRLLEAVEAGSGIERAMKATHRVFAVDIAVVLVALWAMVAKLGAG